MYVFIYVDVFKIFIILYLIFILVGLLVLFSLIVIFFILKFFCFLYKRKLVIEKVRVERDNFEIYIIRNWIFNFEDDDDDEVIYFYFEI